MGLHGGVIARTSSSWRRPTTTPPFPPRAADLVFVSSVYKEIDDRVAYMRKARPLLRAGGRVAILEFRPDARGAGPPRGDRLPSPEQVAQELTAAAFVLEKEHDFLPREYFLVFGLPDPDA